MKNIVLNHDINLQTRLVFLRAYIRSCLTFNCQSWVFTLNQFYKIDATWRIFLRKMIRNDFRRKDPGNENDFKLYYTNDDVHRICNTNDISQFIKFQQRNYAAHLVRCNNDCMTKKTVISRWKMFQTWSKYEYFVETSSWEFGNWKTILCK